MTGCEDYQWSKFMNMRIEYFYFGKVDKRLGHVSACTYIIIFNNVLSLV
jgi:hypothetical protein